MGVNSQHFVSQDVVSFIFIYAKTCIVNLKYKRLTLGLKKQELCCLGMVVGETGVKSEEFT